MFIPLALFCLVATAAAKDLTVGEGGELIYHQNVTASPSVWIRKQNVTIDAPETITRIVIIDNREDKNGEASIVQGGVGFNNVTIELKSPAVFRGFYFEIQVYAKPENGIQFHDENGQQFIKNTFDRDTQVNQRQVPKHDLDVSVQGIVAPVTTSTTQLPNTQGTVQHPVEVGNNDNQKLLQQNKQQNPIAKDLQTESRKPFVNVNVAEESQKPVQHPVQVNKQDTQQVQTGKDDIQKIQNPAQVDKEDTQQVQTGKDDIQQIQSQQHQETLSPLFKNLPSGNEQKFDALVKQVKV